MAASKENSMEYVSEICPNMSSEPAEFEPDPSLPVIKYILSDSNTNLLNLVNTLTVNGNYELGDKQTVSTNNLPYISSPPHSRAPIIGPVIESKEKDQLKQILEQWKFEYLFEMFLEESIDLNALQHMDRDHLTLLCLKSKINVGTMIKLEQQLKLWKAKQSGGENSLKEVPNANRAESNCDGSSSAASSVSLDTILQDTLAGKKFVDNYIKNPSFTDASRSVLLTLITNYFEIHEKKMTADNAKSLSEEIVKKFSSEDIVSSLINLAPDVTFNCIHRYMQMQV